MIPETTSDADEQAGKDAVFIEQYRLTGDPVTACIRAGIRDVRYPITVIAQRQLARPEIKTALAALSRIETSMMPIEVTRESIVADFEEIFEKALTDGQYGAATAAKKAQALTLGILQTTVNLNHSYKVEAMTDDQLLRIASGHARDVTREVQVIDQEEEDI